VFTHPVYLQGIRVKFVYVGYRVKVKVTEVKKVENAKFFIHLSVWINSAADNDR